MPDVPFPTRHIPHLQEAHQHLVALRRQIDALPEPDREALLATLDALEAAQGRIATQESEGPSLPPAEALPITEEALYRNVVAQLSEGIVLVDPQGRIIEWNAAQEKITGLPRSETLGQYAWDVQARLTPDEKRTPAALEANRAQTLDLLATGDAPWLSQVVENEIQRPDGRRPFVQSRVFMIKLRNTFILGSVLRDITIQKRVEDALRESEERLRAIFASAQDAIFMKDRNLVYTHVNPIVEKQNRLPTDQIIGKTDIELFGDDYKPELHDAELRVLAGEIDEREIIAVIQEVSYIFHVIKVPVRDSNGVIIGLCGFARDVTDRRQAEQELQESEARYRALINALTTGVLLVQDGHYIFANPAAAHLMGLDDPAEIVGMSALDSIDPAYHDIMATRIANLDADQPNPPAELKLARADGRDIFVESTSVPITLQGKRTSLIVSQDITAHKELEEALRSSQELYHQLLIASPNVITVSDLNGQIIFVSQQAQETYGLDDPESAIGTSLFDYIAPQDLLRAATDLQEMLEGGQISTSQYTLLKLDGTSFSAEVNAALLRDAKGNPSGIVTITHDVTERLEAERHQLDLAIERERVSVLTDFLQNASHEFSAPLSVINAELYILLRSMKSPEHLERLQRLKDHARQIDELVKAMLTMSRLDSGLPFDFVPTDLNQIVQDTINRLQPQADDKRLKVSVDLDPAWPVVEGDSHELHLALSKVLENAIRFTPDGGTIQVGTHAKGTAVRITVQDTGIGIPAEDLPHVLERFYRVDKARTSRGAGLGLSIAAKIIDNHRGEIHIESMPGDGTTVTLSLPRLENGGVQIV